MKTTKTLKNFRIIGFSCLLIIAVLCMCFSLIPTVSASASAGTFKTVSVKVNGSTIPVSVDVDVAPTPQIVIASDLKLSIGSLKDYDANCRDCNYSYTLKGWKIGGIEYTGETAIDVVDDVTVEAVFEKTLNYYAYVRYIDYDGGIGNKELLDKAVSFGEFQSFPLNTGSVHKTDSKIYTFKRWDKVNAEVDTDSTNPDKDRTLCVKGIFDETERLYTVNFVINKVYNDVDADKVDAFASFSVTSVAVPYNTLLKPIDCKTFQCGSDVYNVTLNENTNKFTYSTDDDVFTVFSVVDGKAGFSFSAAQPSANVKDIVNDDDAVTIQYTVKRAYTKHIVNIVPNESTFGAVDNSSVTVDWGTKIVYDDANKKVTVGTTEITATAIPATAQYTYAFIKWTDTSDPRRMKVEEPMTLTAVFERTLNKYDITFAIDATGNFGELDNKAPIKAWYGSAITCSENVLTVTAPLGYEPSTQTVTAKAWDANVEFTYSHDSWSPFEGNIEGNTTITAKFKKTRNQYNVYVLSNNTAYGTLDSASPAPILLPYGTLYSYSKNILVFKDPDTKTEIARYTATIKPQTSEKVYSFKGWDPLATGTTTDNTVITAKFEESVRQYTVTVKSNNTKFGTVSATSVVVDYGTCFSTSENVLTVGTQAPITANPSANSDDGHYEYKFVNWSWDPSVASPVKANVTIQANFEQLVRNYKVSFNVVEAGYGTVTPSEVIVPWGTKIPDPGIGNSKLSWNKGAYTVTAEPTVADDQYFYDFDCWDIFGEEEILTDTTINVYFDRDDVLHTITFVNPVIDPAQPDIVYGEFDFVGDWTDIDYNTPYTINKNIFDLDGSEIEFTVEADTDEFDYTFVSIDVVSGTGDGSVKTDLVVTATVTRERKQYEVVVKTNANYGTVNETKFNAYYGTQVEYVGNTIVFTAPDDVGGTKKVVTATQYPDDVQYTYGFSSWTPSANPISKDKATRTFTANFTRTVNKYDVTVGVETASVGYGIVTVNGSETAKVPEVPYGTAYTINGNVISVNGAKVKAISTANSQQYTYTFVGWNVVSDGTTADNTQLIAIFKREVNNYTVTFVADETTWGSISPASVSVPYGTVLTENGNKLTAIDMDEVTATEAFDTQEWDYSFVNWTGFPTDMTVVDNITVTAHFSQVKQKYTVTFLPKEAGYGTILESNSIKVDYGTVINDTTDTTLTVNETTFTPQVTAENDQYYYELADKLWGIDTSLTVLKDEIVYVNFKRITKKYTVTVLSENPDYGTVDTASVTVEYDTGINVNGNELHIGGTVVIANPTEKVKEYTYSFKEWTGVPASNKVLTDLTVTVKFDCNWRKYTVVFLNDDDAATPITTIEREYNYVLTAADIPTNVTKEKDNHYTYTFKDWDKQALGATVVGDVTFKATYTSTVRSYKYTFLNYDGTLLETNSFEYGKVFNYQGSEPQRAQDVQYSYKFSGWNPAIVNQVVNGVNYDEVEGYVYKAVYALTERKYSMIFNIKAGTETYGTVKSGIVKEYGYSEIVKMFNDGAKKTVLTVDGLKAIAAAKAREAAYTYSFVEWTLNWPVDVNATVATLTAEFARTDNYYKVTFYDEDRSFIKESVEILCGGDVIDAPTPAKVSDKTYNYAFKNWKKVVGDDIDDLKNVQENYSVYATYTPTYIDYTITLEYEKGVLVDMPTKVDLGSNVVAIDDVALVITFHYDENIKIDLSKITSKCANHTFAGWTGDGYENATLIDSHKGEDITLRAQWTENRITDVTATDTTVTYNGTAQKPTAPVVKAGDKVQYYDETNAKWVDDILTYTHAGEYTVQYRVIRNDYFNFVSTFTMTIEKAPLTVKADDQTSMAEKAMNALTYQITAGKLFETDSLVGELYTEATNAGACVKDIEQGSLVCSSDYDLTFEKGKYTVTERVYSVRFISDNYDNGNIIGSASGIYNRDTINGVIDGAKAKEAKITIGGNDIEAKATANNAEYTYAFVEWSKNYDDANDEAVFTAEFSRTINEYTVTFYDENKVTELGKCKGIPYGTAATSVPAASKADDFKYTYSFKEWLRVSDDGKVELDCIVGSLEVYATYTPTYINYTITLQYNENEGELIDISTKADLGSNVVAADKATGVITYHYDENLKIDLSKIISKYANHTFAGWTRAGYYPTPVLEIDSHKGNITLTAQWTENRITDVTATDTTVTYNGTAQKPTAPVVKAGDEVKYSTDKNVWNDDIPTYTHAGEYTVYYKVIRNDYFDYESKFTMTIKKAPLTVKADDKESMTEKELSALTYTITDVELFGTDKLNGNLTTTARNDQVGTYAITQGTLECTSDYEMTFVPGTYTMTERVYTLNFITGNSLYGKVESYVVAKATKAEIEKMAKDGEFNETLTLGTTQATATPTIKTAEFTYNFVKWSLNFNYSSDIATLIAEFGRVKNKYTVTFMNEDKVTKIAESDPVEYGDIAEAKEIPQDYKDSVWCYTFDKWVNKDGDAIDLTVYSNKTVYASFKKSYRIYTLTVDIGAGEILDMGSLTKYPNNVEKIDGNKVLFHDDTTVIDLSAITWKYDLHSLVGWENEKGTVLQSLSCNIRKDVTLKAVWAENRIDDVDCDGLDTTLTYNGTEQKAKAIEGKKGDKVVYEADGIKYTDSPKFLNVGVYTIAYTVSRKNCYDLTGSYVVEIVPAVITVAADNASSVVGKELVALTWSLKDSVLFANDTITGAIASAAIYNKVGKYAITQGDLNAGSNYTMVFIDGEYAVLDNKLATATKDYSIVSENGFAEGTVLSVEKINLDSDEYSGLEIESVDAAFKITARTEGKEVEIGKCTLKMAATNLTEQKAEYDVLLVVDGASKIVKATLVDGYYEIDMENTEDVAFVTLKDHSFDDYSVAAMAVVSLAAAIAIIVLVINGIKTRKQNQLRAALLEAEKKRLMKAATEDEDE